MASVALIALLVSVALFLVIIVYYWLQLRSGGKSLKSLWKGRRGEPQSVAVRRQHSEGYDSAEEAASDRHVLQPMYVPRDIGHRTGHKRVFITNKGLKVYDTNEFGWPMTDAKETGAQVNA